LNSTNKGKTAKSSLNLSNSRNSRICKEVDRGFPPP
jgi:hypothetical protein